MASKASPSACGSCWRRCGGSWRSREHVAVISRRTVLGVLALALLAAPLAVEAQLGRAASVGVLVFTTPQADPNLPAFREGLRGLGYVEGQNIILEYRFAESQPERLPGLVAELVRLRPDAIVVAGHTPAMQMAKEATRTIPIVIIAAGDPVGSGLIQSFARPGGNVTGLTVLSPELAGKRVELVKEVIPVLRPRTVLWNPTNPAKAVEWQETRAAAGTLGLALQSLEVRTPGDFDRAFATTRGGGTDALVTFAEPLVNSQRKRIVDFTAERRLP